MQSSKFEMLSSAIIEGDQETAGNMTESLLAEGVPPRQILDEGLMPGMQVVGQRFRDNVIFVPEVLIAARAMKRSMEYLEPILSESEKSQSGVVVLGTVKGDIHDIGKNLVGMLLKGAGFKVIDLGINIPSEAFVEAVRKENADLLGLSALLTTTMGGMKTVIQSIRAAQLPVRIMIGGAPVSQHFADEIGADAYAKNASDAVDLAKTLLNQRKE